MQGYEALEPKAVWQIFARMSAVPRPSGHEGAVMESLQKWAAERGLATRRDAVGNMVVSIPASPGREKAAPVVLQGHVDMVCEKNASVSHDFHADPIRMKVEDGWVRAEGTTLGADNGIGVSMALALAADSSVTHGPVEVLMTIDEERGLSGAKGIQAGFFQAKRMINLDSEEDDALFIGCAGGRDSAFDVPFLPGHVDPHWTGRAVAICGLTGGHSGLDIHRNRGNAIRILTRLLLAGWDATPLRIGAIAGGQLRNAIPREASALVSVPADRAAAFEEAVRACFERIRREELSGVDDGVTMAISEAEVSEAVLPEESRRILDLLAAVPHGVTAMSQAVPGLVETSSNLGVVRTAQGQVDVVCCSRSSVGASLDALAAQHLSIARLGGVGITQEPGYPGWKPNPGSDLLGIVRRQYLSVFGREPDLKAVHAGLECGLFTERYPDLDIVSFGPNIVGAHSPDERVEVASVQRVWKLLGGVLEALA